MNLFVNQSIRPLPGSQKPPMAHHCTSFFCCERSLDVCDELLISSAVGHLGLPLVESSRFCGTDSLTCCLLQLQQRFDGGRGWLGFPSRHLLVDYSGTRCDCHFLFGPILLPGGQHVHYRLRFWGMMDSRWDGLFQEQLLLNQSWAADSCWWKEGVYPEHCHESHHLLSCQTPPSLAHPCSPRGPARCLRRGSPAAASRWPTVWSVHSPLLPGRRASAWWEPDVQITKRFTFHISKGFYSHSHRHNTK